MKKYISEIINAKEIEKWKNGNRILIESQTGSGKSEFVKNGLYSYCKKNNKRILLMSNRNLLKNQNKEEILGKEDIISAHNYQEYESKIINGFDWVRLFEEYDYIVYDEAHYFFSDSQFNKNTDILIDTIKNPPSNKILILITATPQALIEYEPNYDFHYELPYDYSYIKNLYFYNRPKNSVPIVESIIRAIPSYEKILYFGSSAIDNYRLSQIVPDSSFICSSGNSLFTHSDIRSMDEIVHSASFSARILFSTKILDNGVNLKDSSLKHIFIDMIDPISFLQCLGRKRILSEDDYINLYVRDYHIGNLHYAKRNFQDKIERVDDFTSGALEDFEDLSAIQKKTGEMINKFYQVNEAKYQHYQTQANFLKEIFQLPDEYKYRKYICNLLSFDYEHTKNANMSYEYNALADLLEKYENIKIFDDEIEDFKTLFFSSIFTPKKTNYRLRGRTAANGILEEDDINFRIASRREYAGIHRGKYYWMVEKRKDN